MTKRIKAEEYSKWDKNIAKELSPLEALEKLGVFHSYDLRLLGENILQLYIKIKGKKLTKIKNLYLESYYGEVYKVKNNTIYYQETFDTLNDVPIKFSEDNWQEYGIIDFIGKKEEYEPKVKTIPMKEWKSIEPALKRLEIIDKLNEKHCEETQNKLKALEIIKEKFVNITILMGCESLEEYNKHPLTMRKGRLTQEELDLLKEELK